MNTKNPPMFVETIQMELDAFIGAIAHRITEYLNAADAPGKVSQPVPHTSLSKTSDLKLPIEGNGMDAVLDDIDTAAVGPAGIAPSHRVVSHCATSPLCQTTFDRKPRIIDV